MSISQQDENTGRLNDALGTTLESISAQVEANLEEGRNRLAEWKVAADDVTRKTIQTLQDLAEQRPWQLVVSAGAAGLLLGLLLGTRRR